MARIRTVKPELWTDENFIELSPMARLLFVASLNFASDYGVLPDKAKTLGMQCLPGDDVDAGALIEECVSAHFYLRETTPDGAKVLLIRTFSDHQRVNRPTPGRWGNPAEWGKTPPEPDPPHGGLTEDSLTEGKGREGKGTGREGNFKSVVRDDLTVPVDNSATDVKERRGQIIHAEAKARTEAQGLAVKHKGPYKAKVIKELGIDYGETIEAMIRKHPMAPDEAIAQRVIHEDMTIRLSDYDETSAA